MSDNRSPSWRGRIERRWRWSSWRKEWGRWCYKTNAQGQTLGMWWEWETP